MPLHRAIFIRAMDIVCANLKSGTPIRPRRWYEPRPRGDAGRGAGVLTANVPAIAATPSSTNPRSFSGSVLTVPQ
jgi:hypothetical protein